MACFLQLQDEWLLRTRQGRVSRQKRTCSKPPSLCCLVMEVEALSGETHLLSLSRGEHEGSLRMKTELLVQMDGLARSEDLVFVLAASNLPW